MYKRYAKWRMDNNGKKNKREEKKVKKFKPRRFKPMPRSLMNDEKAVALTYISGVVAIFITIIVWRVLTICIEPVMQVIDNLRPPENILGGVETRAFQITVWNIICFIVVICIIAWMIVRSQKEIYGTGYTGGG